MSLPKHGWPSREESKAAGCRCEWVGAGAIFVFDRDCPVLDRHKMPDGPVNWADEVYLYRRESAAAANADAPNS